MTEPFKVAGSRDVQLTLHWGYFVGKLVLGPAFLKKDFSWRLLGNNVSYTGQWELFSASFYFRTLNGIPRTSCLLLNCGSLRLSVTKDNRVYYIWKVPFICQTLGSHGKLIIATSPSRGLNSRLNYCFWTGQPQVRMSHVLFGTFPFVLYKSQMQNKIYLLKGWKTEDQGIHSNSDLLTLTSDTCNWWFLGTLLIGDLSETFCAFQSNICLCLKRPVSILVLYRVVGKSLK